MCYIAEDCQKLLQIIENEDWDAVDYDTVVELIDQSEWTAEKKQEIYEVLYNQLRLKEYRTICNWVKGKLNSWFWILVQFPVSVTLFSIVLGIFSPWLFIAGMMIVIGITIADVWGKIQSIKAKERLDYLNEKGFNLCSRFVPVLWESQDSEKNC